MAPAIVYTLCAASSLLCAALLLRAYRARRTKLLLWSSISFAGLALNNILLFIDVILLPTVDFAVLRAATALAAVMVLLVALIWQTGE